MFHLHHTRKRPEKKSVTAVLYEDPDRLVVAKNGAVIGARVGDRGDEKQGCLNRAVIGARVGDREETRPCHIASAARRPRRGRTRTRARPSRLRAVAGRKIRDETRPSGGKIADKQL